jgi:hypothetical protein
MELLITVTQLRTHILTLTRMDITRRTLTATVIQGSALDLVTVATTAADSSVRLVDSPVADSVVLGAASAVAEQFAAAAVFVAAAGAANV